MVLVAGTRLVRTWHVVRVAIVALVATLLVVVGAHGRYATQLPAAVPALGLHAPPAPTETTGDAPHVLDAPGLRLGERQARHRQAQPRRADAGREAPRSAPVARHVAALRGAADAVAIAARERERTAPRRPPADHPATPPAPRGPPSIG